MGEPARLDDPTTNTAEPVELPQLDDFAAIVRREQAMVYSMALHFLRDPQAAEEVAQDVFFHLHSNLETLKSPEHITFWLRRVTSHRCIDYSRRRRRFQISLEDAPEPRAAASVRDPMLARRLRRLVASLPRKARMIVILRYQEDLTPAEIADVLAMPIATVKSHLQRSLVMLREKAARIIGEVRV